MLGGALPRATGARDRPTRPHPAACLLRRPALPPAPSIRSERDRLYERAERVGALLSHLGEQLKEAIADVNESTCERWPLRWAALGAALGCRRRWACLAAHRLGRAGQEGPRAGPRVPSLPPTHPPTLAPLASLPTPCAAAASLGDTATPLGKAVRVLNNQLQALAQVDARIDELGARVSELRTA